MENRLRYNIPSCGTLTANLFKYTCSLMEFLNYYKHIDRFKRINQLGKLSEVYEGVHHKRYDYVFLQLALISELCKNKKNEFGLSSKRHFCGVLPSIGKEPSVGELLQCLAILSNIGYLEGTFATARAWLTYLKKDRTKYNNFKSGLAKQDLKAFEGIVRNYDYYKFNVILGLFFLQRYKKKSKEHCEFASNILRLYLKHDFSDIQQSEFLQLYRTIRTVSFITLDSFYTPVPFNLELSSILLGFDTLYESLFVKNTTYKIALRNLERVLQDSVYLSSDSCLCTARTSEDKLEEIKEFEIDSMLTLYYSVCPACNKEDLNQKIKELDWIREKKLLLKYRYSFRSKDKLPEALNDELSWEIQTRNKIGKSSCRVGLLKNARNNEIRLVFGLTSKDDLVCVKSALKCISEAIKFRKEFGQGVLNEYRDKNPEEYLRFILKSLFGWEKRFILENKNERNKAIFITQGKTELLNKIDEYIKTATEYLTSDGIFEVEKMKDLVNKVNYSGLTLCYIGETKLFEAGKSTNSAEYDGILITPNTIDNQEAFSYILEAKNKQHGSTEAQKQIKERVTPHLSESLKMEVIKLGNKSAYARIYSE